MTSFAALLALIAFGPTQTVAEGPGGKGHGGNNGHGGGHYGGGGGYYGGGGGYYGGGGGYYGGSGWYGYGLGYGPGYGYSYGYYNPVVPYVVQRPIIVENPTFSGLPIKINNPATNSVTLSYVLNDVSYSIPPGYSQDLTLDRSWVISFSRGENFGSAQYGLEPGLYTFDHTTDHGWELYHRDAAQPNIVQTPSNMLPTSPTPSPAMPVTPPAPRPMQ